MVGRRFDGIAASARRHRRVTAFYCWGDANGGRGRRKRFEQQRSDYIQFAAMDLVRELLPVVDDFERALKAESADHGYAKGVELIYQRLYETLKRMGLEPFDTTGQRFDPNLHQAVERVPSEEVEDQTILGEFQRGYNFKGRLLRPAMVRVAVKP